MHMIPFLVLIIHHCMTHGLDLGLHTIIVGGDGEIHTTQVIMMDTTMVFTEDITITMFPEIEEMW